MEEVVEDYCWVLVPSSCAMCVVSMWSVVFFYPAFEVEKVKSVGEWGVTKVRGLEERD